MSREHKTSTEALKSHKSVVHHSQLMVFANKTLAHTNTKELRYLPPTCFHMLRLGKHGFGQTKQLIYEQRSKIIQYFTKKEGSP